MAGRAAVGVDDDLAAGQTGVGVGAAELEAAGGVDEHPHALGGQVVGQDRVGLIRLLGRNFDVEAYRYACRVTITAQEIIVDNGGYPTPRIEENSHKFRPLGLGYANLGALLMSRGLAYDSDDGRNFSAALTSVMTLAWRSRS